MRRALGGYTIVEVMIFLTVSGVIFAGAVLSFSGQQGKSRFEQGAHDLLSKIQDYVDRTSTGLFPGNGQYSCTVASGGRAQLKAGGSGTGTNQACIFLGRTVQVIPGQSKMFIYTVLGRYSNDSNEPVTSFADALPEPAISPIDLTEEYDTPWGSLKSSKITPIGAASSSDSDLVGFYNSLQDGYYNSGSQGNQSVIAKGYSFTGDLNSVKSAGLQSCIEEQNANGYNCLNTPQISSWNLCFTSTGSSQTAVLTLTSTPAGITADLNFTSC